MFNPLSFQIDVSVDRANNAKEKEEGYLTRMEFGVGKTIEVMDSFYMYAMLNNSLLLGGFVPHNSAYSIGPEGGVLLNLSPVALKMSAERPISTSDFPAKAKYNGELAYHLSKDFALTLETVLKDNYGRDENQYLAGIRVRFK